MKQFTANRAQNTADEIWFLEHFSVYTQGLSCKDMPGLNAQDIPVVHSDRGGQMTYHGPGQLVIYFLMDIKRLKTGPKSFVNLLEELVIEALSEFGIIAEKRAGAHGVYVADKKIAALGLRISRGCCYHGLSINVDMDLSPFYDIIPCGLKDIEITRISDYHPGIDIATVKQTFKQKISDRFSARLIK
jgi:lipoyl(octanoyl) transferase